MVEHDSPDTTGQAGHLSGSVPAGQDRTKRTPLRRGSVCPGPVSGSETEEGVTTAQPDEREVEAIGRALDALLRTLIANDLNRRSRPTGSKSPVRMDMSNYPSAAERFSADPIGEACREAVRNFGERLFDVLGSTDAMRDVLNRVAEMDPARAGRRASILDHGWDGIGSNADRWWA